MTCGTLPPSNCTLDWYYCPRDPGCATYRLSVTSVEVDVKDKSALAVGDAVRVLMKGRTDLQSVPVGGSYRIYALAGGNAYAGVLTEVLTVYPKQKTFALDIPFKLTSAFFSGKGPPGQWFQFGVDIF